MTEDKTKKLHEELGQLTFERAKLEQRLNTITKRFNEIAQELLKSEKS